MEDKFIYGAYSNMAVDNFQLSLTAIARKYANINIPLTDNNCDEFMNLLFSCDVKINNIEKVFSDKFLWIIPLLDRLGYKNSDSYQVRIGIKECCSKFYKLLVKIRNFHTHYFHNQITIDCLVSNNDESISFFRGLESIYDGALNEIKKRFGADESEVAHLRRMRCVDKTVSIRDETDGFYYKLSRDNEFSEKGTAYFITLFLNKKYGYLFLRKLSNFKLYDDAKYRFTLETFTALSTRPAIDKLKYEIDDKLNLSLDMLNELSKVPINLFDTLSNEDQMRYRNIEQDDEQIDVDEFTRSRMRHRSRFEYFALRHLDGLADFANIGFYTYLGNYHHKMYAKTLLDGVTEDRQINFQLAGFCKNIDADVTERLERVTKMPIDKIEQNHRVTINEFKPYIEEVNPHYIINNNTIGIKILTDGRDEFPIFDNSGAKMPTPDFWLSKYELPAMVFYSYLKTKRPEICPKSVVDIIKESIADHTYQTKRGEDRSVLIIRKIRREILWTDSKLKEIERANEDSKATFGKKQYITLKAGVIAKILAKDIIELQPSIENGKDKITGANFQSLQRSLAYFESNRAAFYDIFQKASLLESKNCHPFLIQLFSSDNSFNYSSLQLFYKGYLLKRKAYFDVQEKKALKGAVNFVCYSLRKLQKSSEPTDVSKLPVFLPRGLFDHSIKEALSQTALHYECRTGRNNTYLIKLYFEVIEKNSTQPFYSENRAYHFFDKVINEKNKSKVAVKNCLSLEQRKQLLSELKPKPPIAICDANDILEKEDMLYRKSYNEVYDNESLLRFTELQDIVLFLISKSLLPGDLTGVDDYKLAGIKNLLSHCCRFTVKIPETFQCTVVADNVKIRDYGKVNSVKNDKKFRSLLKMLFKKKTGISYLDYLQESQDYEDARVSIIQYSHLLESKMVAKFPNISKEESSGYYNFREIVETFPASDFSYDSTKCKNIIEIRNGFSHNDYPNITVVNESIEANSIFLSKPLRTYFEKEITELIGYL